MKNKYILAIILTLFTITASACQTRTEQTTIQKETTVSDEGTTDSPDDGASKESTDTTDDMDSKKDAAPDTTAEDDSFVMEEQSLLDYEGLSLKALSWDSGSAALKVQAENSSDKDYIIQFIDTSVNDFMIESGFSMNVKANAQDEKDAEFSLTDLDSCGINDVVQIQTKVLVLDSISFDTVFTSDVVTIQTGDPSSQQAYDESGDILYEENGLKIVSHGFVDDSNHGKLWKLYIANDSGQDYCFYSPDVTLNDNTMDVLFSVTVPDGKKAVSSMTIFQDDLDKYEITDINSAQMTLKLQNPETFETIETININLG